MEEEEEGTPSSRSSPKYLTGPYLEGGAFSYERGTPVGTCQSPTWRPSQAHSYPEYSRANLYPCSPPPPEAGPSRTRSSHAPTAREAWLVGWLVLVEGCAPAPLNPAPEALQLPQRICLTRARTTSPESRGPKPEAGCPNPNPESRAHR